MIQIADKKDCCGCGACANICPKNCIRMRPDSEGFLYPSVDQTACIQCGQCEKVCPVLHVAPEKECRQTGYVVQNKDDRIRKASTSGGAFSAIAAWVIQQGGVVFGAAYDDHFMVEHTSAENSEDLARFRNSKYVQSSTKNTFRQVKDHLLAGRWVCYSGTPCQIEGLKAYLGKEYEKLVTVDIVCHAVPSPLVWQKYLEMQKEKLGDFFHIMFREKHYGYKYSTMSFFDHAGKTIYAHGIDTDPMLRAFFSNICDRPSCYSCVFKKRYRVSDFTIWDCFSVFRFDKAMDDDRGTTKVLIHTEKGRSVFEAIKPSLRWREVPPDQLIKGMREMVESVEMNPRREAFLQDANQLSGPQLFEKYFPETWKVKITRLMRVSLCRVGVYAFAKKMLARLRNI